MTDAQRVRMMHRFDQKRLAAPVGGPDRALCKIVLAMLGYRASVRNIAARSAQFHRRYGSTV